MSRKQSIEDVFEDDSLYESDEDEPVNEANFQHDDENDEEDEQLDDDLLEESENESEAQIYVPVKKSTKRVTKTTKKVSKATKKTVRKRKVKDEELDDAEEEERPSARRKTTKKTTKKAKVKKESKFIIRDWEKYMSINPSLVEIQAMVDLVSSDSSSLKKQEYLSQNPRCVKALYYAYNPFLMFNLTSKALAEPKTKAKLGSSNIFKKLGKETNDIFELLDILTDKKVSGHAAICTAYWFISKNKLFTDLIGGFLDKNLGMGMGAKGINPVYPGLIPMFNVSLANTYDEKMAERVDFESENWVASRKYDGNRGIIIIDSKGKITFLSRYEKEWFTLGQIERRLKTLKLTNMILDCEVCLFKPDGTEDFARVTGELKKAGEIKNPRVCLFDMIDAAVFYEGEGGITYAERQKRMHEIIGEKFEPFIHIVEQVPIKNSAHLDEMTEESKKSKWEGLIIRNIDVPFEGKRSNNMLKVKGWIDDEFVVEDVEINPKYPCVDKKTHTHYFVRALKSVVIRLKTGHKVNVGTGFDLEQRIAFAKNPNLIIGKEITVKFFENTKNKKGGKSLRFPVFKHLWESGKRDM
jgi:DNA ligase-1